MYSFLKTHRRRIARIVAVVAFLVIGMHLVQHMPRDVEIRYDLGPAHDAVSALFLSYQSDGGEVAGVRFEYRAGAPRVIRHTASLIPGRYDVVAMVSRGRATERVQRSLRVPADGVIRIDLFDLGYASMLQLSSDD